MVAIVGVFTLIIRNGVRHVRRTGKWYLVQAPTDVLMLSLFVADLIQAVGAVMDVRWVHSGKVEVGAFCTAQGVVQQLGETSVAITTLMITLFTFAGIWFRKGLESTYLATFLMALAWLFVALMVALGNATNDGPHDMYESPTPYWCWIGQSYLGLRIAGEYVWFWANLGVSSVAYLLLFLWARGNITVSERAWWRCSFHSSSGNASRAVRRTARTMLAYPACYCVLVLPLSIVRWLGFSGHTIPSAATFGVISVYGLSGMLNVALLLYTRPNSVLFGDGRAALHPGQGRTPSAVQTFRMDESQSPSDFGGVSRDSSLRLGRLPSAQDPGGWDPRTSKGVLHLKLDDDLTVNAIV